MSLNLSELANEFGNLLNNGYIHALLIVIMLDIITGNVKAWIKKENDSTVGLFGAIKHLIVAVTVVTVYPYLKLFGLEIYADGFVVSIIAAYVTSFLENWVEIGLPMNAHIKDALAKLNKKNTVLK